MHKKLLGTIAATMLALASPALAEYNPPAGAVRANYEALARTPEKYKARTSSFTAQSLRPSKTMVTLLRWR